MAEFFCELLSEEIPARMQARAAEDFCRLVGETFAALSPRELRGFSGPRRIAVAAELAAEVAAARSVERGPRATAPDAAVAGFLRKHGAGGEALRQEGEFFVLERASAAMPAGELIASAMPGLLRRFPWPKSMRWGGTSQFTWVRPLRRILCLLGGEIVPFALAAGDDDGHGLASGDLTEGHRVPARSTFAVRGVADWQAQLGERRVIADAAAREAAIASGIAARAAALGLAVVPDAGLLREVAGLVEWPVVLAGRIDAAFMDLPPEVMQVSMRVNQRYFATRAVDGRAAPWFLFAANVEAPDGGAAIVAGNERVLRARFSDARHFWDLDRRTPLADRVADLEGMTFHAALGSQGARVRRIAALASGLADACGADRELAWRAALLAKADLTSGMIGEFPELQGVMGGYYARHDGEADDVAAAVREHYLPKGPGDAVPASAVGCAVALADKIDQLAGFFLVGERPTGSGDPYALRRAALGVIRVVRERGLRIGLLEHLRIAVRRVAEDVRQAGEPSRVAAEVLAFVAERLRVQLRAEGARHDVLAAVFAAGGDDDLVRLLKRAAAVAGLLGSANGGDLLAAYKRAANILRIEERKDGPHEGAVDPDGFIENEENVLHDALVRADVVTRLLEEEQFEAAVAMLANLREKLDMFFEKVVVNAADPALRKNRLNLLASVRRAMNQVADFSAIEG